MQRELKLVIGEGQSISDVVGLVAPFLGWGRMRVGGGHMSEGGGADPLINQTRIYKV